MAKGGGKRKTGGQQPARKGGRKGEENREGERQSAIRKPIIAWRKPERRHFFGDFCAQTNIQNAQLVPGLGVPALVESNNTGGEGSNAAIAGDDKGREKGTESNIQNAQPLQEVGVHALVDPARVGEKPGTARRGANTGSSDLPLSQCLSTVSGVVSGEQSAASGGSAGMDHSGTGAPSCEVPAAVGAAVSGID